MGEIDRIPQIGSVPILTSRSGDRGRRHPHRDKLPPRDIVEVGDDPIDEPHGEIDPSADSPVEGPYRLDIAA